MPVLGKCSVEAWIVVSGSFFVSSSTLVVVVVVDVVVVQTNKCDLDFSSEAKNASISVSASSAKLVTPPKCSSQARLNTHKLL